MSTERFSEFNRRFSGMRSKQLLVWLAAALVFLFLLLVAPHTKDPNFVIALAVAWPILLAFVSAWRIRR
jgi:ABC-type Na+ efflux pump permease subunit